jgi:ABC-type multidrug transport system permease subunit
MVHLIASAAATQITIGLVQGVLMLLFGIILVGLDMTWQQALLVLGAMTLSGLAFVAFGSAIAAFSHKSDFAGYVFFFTILPLTFLASFPPDMMPEALNTFTPWLPTSMAIELIGPLFLTHQLSDGAFLAAIGLAGYAILFAGISAIKFRWQS